jgi:hypothetical protein
MNSFLYPEVEVSFKTLAARLAFIRPLLRMQCHVRLELRNGLRKGMYSGCAEFQQLHFF